MKQYLNLVRHTLQHGSPEMDRTGTGTIGIFGHQMRFDLKRSFPLLTTKRVHLRSIIQELLWFLSGSTNNNDLVARGCTIWDEWARADGDLGPIYGRQWRSWPTPDGHHIDQISAAIEMLRTNPASRRNIVSAWNVGELDQMALHPCHALFQFHARELTLDERLVELWAGGGALEGSASEEFKHICLDEMGIPRRALSCQLYQRSADIFLGVPFNIASYALLTMMVAQQCDMLADEFIWTGGDCHIYRNHMDQVKLQLTREALPPPTMKIRRAPSIFEYTAEDFVLVGYEPHPAIKAPVAV